MHTLLQGSFLLTEIYKSINNLSPPIMKDFFDLKNNRYDLRNKLFVLNMIFVEIT